MKNPKRILVCALALIGILTVNGPAQWSRSEPAESASTPRDLLYARVRVTDLSGLHRGGFYVGFERDTVWIMEMGALVGIPFDVISAIRIADHADPMNVVIPGVFVGAWGMMGAFEDHHSMGGSVPVGFDTDRELDTYALTVAGGVGAGALLYLLTMSYEEYDRDFTFEEHLALRDAAERRWRSFASQEDTPNRIHFFVFGGEVSVRVPFTDDQYSWTPYGNSQLVAGYAKMNIFRRFQATYSLTPYLDVGGAVVRFSDPGFYARMNKVVDANHSQNTSYDERLDATLYGGVLELHPLTSALHPFDWKLSGALGVATVDFSSLMTNDVQTYSPYFVSSLHEDRGYSRTTIGAMIATSLEVYLTDHFSIGGMTEYTWAFGLSMPELTQWNVSSRTAGNRCFGAFMGFHF